MFYLICLAWLLDFDLLALAACMVLGPVLDQRSFQWIEEQIETWGGTW